MSAVKTHPATLFRRLLAAPGLIRGINIYDPLTARLAQQTGFVACRADKNFDQYATAASLRGYRDQAVTPEQMQAVTVPTLGIVGTLDHTLKEMQELKRLRADMTLVLIEGVPHTGPNGIQGRPELIAALRAFFAKHAQ